MKRLLVLVAVVMAAVVGAVLWRRRQAPVTMIVADLPSAPEVTEDAVAPPAPQQATVAAPTPTPAKKAPAKKAPAKKAPAKKASAGAKPTTSDNTAAAAPRSTRTRRTPDPGAST